MSAEQAESELEELRGAHGELVDAYERVCAEANMWRSSCEQSKEEGRGLRETLEALRADVRRWLGPKKWARTMAEANGYDAILAAVDAPATQPNGAALIAAERRRQPDLGWTPEHDDRHTGGDLVRAAVCYADAGWIAPARDRPPAIWPWDGAYWRPGNDPIRNLVKAGALLAAEIDRLQRAVLAAEQDRRENDR